MTSKTTYICDQCLKEISGLDGPIFISMQHQQEPQLNQDQDFCSYKCIRDWAEKLVKGSSR